MEPKLLTAERFVDMRTECSYRYIYGSTERFRPHYHDYSEIFLVLTGTAQHIVGNSVIPLKPRDLVLIRPHDVHDYISHDRDAFSMLNITFSMDTLNQIYSFLGSGFPSETLMTAPLPPSVRLNHGEFAALHAKMTSISAIPGEEIDQLKTSLRMLLFEIFSNFFSSFTVKKHTIPPWLEALCGEMRKNGGFVEGRDKLFSMTDKSREHVCRSMKKYMGITVSDFINELRLNYICNMLRVSNHTIADIVFESGFNNLSWAAELFKEKYGTTMRQYRKDFHDHGIPEA